ncbi:hypothetical protein [Mycobacterium vicinigordonae]|uniref:Proline rich protein n=1 Tax=Mycobacterium vicinigordonae TaxID=1719132 RepID=A0A7D6HZM0_9MYCO|nr:hypothetical protein [Mycobacterium vicinigordonae]QLL08755.1 hypothetical protein H0P51_07525 [Mycobacterium vicinigordonae]
MKLDLNLLHKPRPKEERRTPLHLFGGRIRTSTIVLIVLFFALWWTYDTYRPEPATAPSNTPQLVPPGYVPDPNYTWVPRTRVQQRPQDTPTYTPTRTSTPTTTPPPPPPTTTTTTPAFPPPLPCLLPPPFCPATSSPSPSPTELPQQPLPGQAPTPTSTPPGR